ncbi:MAG: hypothetical protein DMG96_25690 [Acidobacteria bacterium]|nr:MAG: hypothetical protein DMG96_25690 [Acidobacteriota bacterium]
MDGKTSWPEQLDKVVSHCSQHSLTDISRNDVMLALGALHNALRPAEVECVLQLDIAFMEDSLALVRLGLLLPI